MTKYTYKPYQKSFDEGYEAGKNGWRYNEPDFRTDAVANEAYNKGWKKGCDERHAWDKANGWDMH